MAYYYKLNDFDAVSSFDGLLCEKLQKSKASHPKIQFDFSRHVLIELLDDSTPEEEIWHKLNLTCNANVIHKRLMIDSHRINCRRAIVVFNDSNEAKLQAVCLSQVKIGTQNICAAVVEEILIDLCLFEKQIIQFGDKKPQHQLLYVSDLKSCYKPMELIQFLKEIFSPFGSILSVFTCTADDGYAYPEGVIKFAYLSEAFAAEIAFDQFVVGKEKLSVTTHHNILLSQCDLRLRLRNAQYNNILDCNNLVECPVPCYNSYDFKSAYEDCLINTFNKCQISLVDNYSEKDMTICNSRSEDFNSRTNMYDTTLNILPIKCRDSSELSEVVSTCSENTFDIRSDKSTKSKTNRLQNMDYVKKRQSALNSSENISIPKILSNKTDFGAASKVPTKHSTKRKKRFIPSQKLCLKSQRIALSQNSSRKDNDSDFHSSQPAESTKSKNQNMSSLSSECLNSQPYDPMTQGCSKVCGWLLNLSGSNGLSGTGMVEENSEKTLLNPHLSSRKISFHATPSLRRNKIFDIMDIKSHYSSKNNVENEDPNINTTILPEKNAYTSENLKSPLKAWLRQELLSSINNTVTTCQDVSKSIIVCATKTKDIAISVGCSHILCDHCYPSSTNLLLGYC